MTSQIIKKASTLADIIANSGLAAGGETDLAKLANQQVTHKSLYSEKDLGKEQTTDLHEGVPGVLADTQAAENETHEKLPSLPNVQNLNTTGEAALNNRGTEINDMKSDGTPTGKPSDVVKNASYYRNAVAAFLGQQRKNAAAAQAQTQAQAPKILTGTEAMQRIASCIQKSTDADLQEAQNTIVKLASENPVFNICRERCMQVKMAEDVAALADAEGIAPEEAAAMLDEQVAENPEMAEEINDEATAEAVSDLADAEAATGELIDDVDAMAANASEALGREVTPEEIIDAADTVVAQADELGIEPEALLQAALDQMTSDSDVSEDDVAMADQLLEAAAAEGITPEEVVQILAEDMGGEDMGGGEAAEAAPEEVPVEKAASLQKLASAPRAAYVFLKRRGLA